MTCCTKQRLPRFLDALLVTAVLAQFERSVVDHSFEVLAYCFMSDHVQFLVEGASAHSDLKQFVRFGKQRGEHIARARSRISNQAWT